MALMAPGGGITALREVFGELLRDHDAVRRVADLMAGADLRRAAARTPIRSPGGSSRIYRSTPRPARSGSRT
jgi:hypothetical protein